MGTASSLLWSRTQNEHSPAHGDTSDRVLADPEMSSAGGRKILPATKHPSADTLERVVRVEMSTVDPDPPFRTLPVPNRPRPRSRRHKSAGWIRAGASPEEMDEVKRQAHLEGWNLISEAKRSLSLHGPVVSRQCVTRARNAFRRGGAIPLEAEAALTAADAWFPGGDEHKALAVHGGVRGGGNDALTSRVGTRLLSGVDGDGVEHTQRILFSLPPCPHTDEAAARNPEANAASESAQPGSTLQGGDMEDPASCRPSTSEPARSFVSQRPHSAHPRYTQAPNSPEKSKRNRVCSPPRGRSPSSAARAGGPSAVREGSPTPTSRSTRMQRPTTAMPGSEVPVQVSMLNAPASRDTMRPSSAFPQPRQQRRFSMQPAPNSRPTPSTPLPRSASARALARVSARDLSSTNDQYIVSTPSSRPTTPYTRTTSPFVGAWSGGTDTGTPTHIGVRTPTHVRPSTAQIRPSTATRRPRTASMRPSTASMTSPSAQTSPFSPWMLQRFGSTTTPKSSPQLGRVTSMPSLLSGAIRRPFSAMALRRLSVVVGSKPGGELLSRSQHDTMSTSRPNTASRGGGLSRDGQDGKDAENVQRNVHQSVQNTSVRRTSVLRQLGRFLGDLDEQSRDLEDAVNAEDDGNQGGCKRNQLPRQKTLVVPREGPSPDRLHVAHRVCVRIPEGVSPGEVIYERYSNGEIFSYMVPDLDGTFEFPDEPENVFATVTPVGYEIPEHVLVRLNEEEEVVHEHELSARKLIPDYVPAAVKGGVLTGYGMQRVLREETPEDYTPGTAIAFALALKKTKYVDGPNIGQKFRRRSLLEIDKQMEALKKLSKEEREELGIEELEVKLEEERRKEKEMADAEERKRRELNEAGS